MTGIRRPSLIDEQSPSIPRRLKFDPKGNCHTARLAAIAPFMIWEVKAGLLLCSLPKGGLTLADVASTTNPRVFAFAGSVLRQQELQMDFTIRPLDLTDAVARASQLATKAPSVTGSGFKDAMLQALQATSDLQTESGRLSREFSLDNPTVSLEQTMLAGVKSSIAFQATLQVRNRVAQAYAEIMNMQV